MGEAVQLRQGFPALGSERIGLVEDGGDAALFGEGWKRNFQRLEKVSWNAPLTCATGHLALTISSNFLSSQEMNQIPAIKFCAAPDNMELG